MTVYFTVLKTCRQSWSVGNFPSRFLSCITSNKNWMYTYQKSNRPARPTCFDDRSIYCNRNTSIYYHHWLSHSDKWTFAILNSFIWSILIWLYMDVICQKIHITKTKARYAEFLTNNILHANHSSKRNSC